MWTSPCEQTEQSIVYLPPVSAYTSIDRKMGVDYGSIENVTLKNVVVFGDSIPSSSFRAQSIHKRHKGNKIHGIHFKGLTFNGKRITNEQQAGFRKGRLVGAVPLEE